VFILQIYNRHRPTPIEKKKEAHVEDEKIGKKKNLKENDLLRPRSSELHF
jgi:hypothetical protein